MNSKHQSTGKRTRRGTASVPTTRLEEHVMNRIRESIYGLVAVKDNVYYDIVRITSDSIWVEDEELTFSQFSSMYLLEQGILYPSGIREYNTDTHRWRDSRGRIRSTFLTSPIYALFEYRIP